jgi:cytochrome c
MNEFAKAVLRQLAIAALMCGPASAEDKQSNDDLELAFNGHCRECHSFDKADNRLGPTLYGVVGRKAGTVPDFAYSDAVKTSGITWDEKTLDAWITKPNALIPNNNMGTIFPGVSDPAIRAKIIAFLKQDTQMGAPAKK